MTLLKIGLVLIVLYIHSGWTQKLKIATLNMSAPYVIEHSDGYTEGFIIDLLEEMGVEYELVSPQDRKYGKQDENTGKWSGLMGMVVDRKADAVGMDLTITAERAKAVDFTVPFLDSKLVIVSKEIVSTPDVVSLVFAPFTAPLWILFLVAYLLTSLVFWLISRISPLEEKECILDSFWGIASAFVFVSRPTPCSRRLVVLGWWIFALIVFVGYAVTLQPFMASGKVAFRYKSVSDMLSNPAFRFGTFKGGATHQLLKTSTDEITMDIFSRITENEAESFFSGNVKMTEFLEKPDGENWGMIMESGSATYLIRNHCEHYIVGSLATRYYGFAVPKGSPNRNMLSQKVLNAGESGGIQALKSKWWEEGECTNNAIVGSSAEKAMQLDIPQLGGAFVLLLVFLIVGLLVSIWELISGIKKEPHLGPAGRALKEAFCGCFPTKKPKTKKVEEVEATSPAVEEKQNGAENLANGAENMA